MVALEVMPFVTWKPHGCVRQLCCPPSLAQCWGSIYFSSCSMNVQKNTTCIQISVSGVCFWGNPNKDTLQFGPDTLSFSPKGS